MNRREFLLNSTKTMFGTAALASFPLSIQKALAIDAKVESGTIQDGKHIVILTQDRKQISALLPSAQIEHIGGWGALLSVARNLKRQDILGKGSITLLNINQPTGFDCPGCAWPEKKDAHAFNFCENGAKAVAFEATSKTVTPEYFAGHTVSWLSEQSDFFLEDLGRLTDPVRYDAATDKYVPISWDDAMTK